MKKILKTVLIAFGVLFVSFIVLGVIGMQMEEKSPTVRSDTPESIPVQATENTTVVAAESGKTNSELLLMFESEGDDYIGGLIFENGDKVVLSGKGSKYKRISINNTGTCFAFACRLTKDVIPWDGMDIKSEPFNLQPGMVVFVNYLGNLYVYRKNDKPGIPVIAPYLSMYVSKQKAIHVTVRNSKMVESYSFGNRIGKEKIVIIPVEGAAVYFAFGDEEEQTLKDSFDKAVQPNVQVDYSAIDIQYGKWEILAPSTEVKPIELSKSILQQILDH